MPIQGNPSERIRNITMLLACVYGSSWGFIGVLSSRKIFEVFEHILKKKKIDRNLFWTDVIVYVNNNFSFSE